MNSRMFAALFVCIAALTGQAADACPAVSPPACEGALTPIYDAKQCLTGYSCAPEASAGGASCVYNGHTYASGAAVEMPGPPCPPTQRCAVSLIMRVTCYGGLWGFPYSKDH